MVLNLIAPNYFKALLTAIRGPSVGLNTHLQPDNIKLRAAEQLNNHNNSAVISCFQKTG